MSATAQGSRSKDLPDRVDVVVVGGGIAGASAAYHLAARGADVLLLERGSVGGGATAAAVGVLSPPLRQPFHETAHLRGQRQAEELWLTAQRSIDGLADLLRRRGEAEEAGLDLTGGYVLAEPHTDHQVRLSFDALKASGMPVEWIGPDEIRRICGGRGFTGAYRIERGGSLSPGATATLLAGAARDEGARIVEDVDVVATESTKRGVICRANDQSVRCDVVVYATHVDSGRFSEFVDREVIPIRGQGFSSERRAPVFRGAFTTHWKLNVWRQTPTGRILMSGWRHDAWDRAYGQRAPQLDEGLQGDIHRWFEQAFPALAPLEIKDRWSGVFGWTADFLPLVGRLPGTPNEFIVTGFSGGGLPFAFECGRYIALLATGGEPPPGSAVFSPARFRRR